MTVTRNQRKPTFLWQALLILLPVVVLAVVGVISLRQDKILAQHEATVRAQALADDLLPQIWNELTATDTNNPSQCLFQVDLNGQLVFPPAYHLVPTPKPFDLTELNPEQKLLWRISQSEEMTHDDTSLILIYQNFIDTNPPDRFAAAAHYGLGLLFTRQKDLAAAAERFNLVAEKYPDAVGESGLSLRPLALVKLFEIEPGKNATLNHFQHAGDKRTIRWRSQKGANPILRFELDHYVSLDYVCSNLVSHPTPLTSYLLQELQERWIPAGTPEMQETIRQWQRTWTEHEFARALFATAGEHFHAEVSIAARPGLVAAMIVRPTQIQTRPTGCSLLHPSTDRTSRPLACFGSKCQQAGKA